MSIRRMTTVVAVLMIGAAQHASADTVLLNAINVPLQTDTPYDLSFVATESSTSISIGGYQVPGDALLTHIGVFLDNTGPNLLGSSWVFTPAAQGSDSVTFGDGTSVPALHFAGVSVGYYDTYSQTFSTTVGQSYSLDLLFTEGFGTPNGFLVTTTASAVPEPSSLVLAGIAATAGLGMWARKRLC